MDKYGEMLVFLTVGQEGSFSAAARRHDLSPSAVSKMMGRLELRLGVRLFDRMGGAVRLTQEGRAFQQGTQRAVDAVAAAEETVRPREDEVSGLLTIQAPFTTLKYLVAPTIPAFLAQHPRIEISFVVGTEKPDLLKEGIDIAIHSEQLADTSLVQKPLALRPWVVAAAPGYLERHGRPGAPEDLLAHNCLTFSVRSNWNVWHFRQAGMLKTLRVRGNVTANQAELLRELALQGVGIVRLSEFNIARDLAANTLVQLLEDFMEPPAERLYLFHAAGRPVAPRVQAFVQFIAGRPWADPIGRP